MRIAPWLMAGFFLAAATSAQDAQRVSSLSPQALQRMKRLELEARAMELRPRRRDTPLRDLNISDDEVREIQREAEKYIARIMLNISPVIAGCPCEEGPLCTDQVYVIPYAAEKMHGLQLSRVKNVWLVGVVQQWWLKYDELRARRNKMDYLAYSRAESELFRDFPSCAAKIEGKK